MRTVNVIEAIFFAALEKQTQIERNAYLDEACTGDPELRRCVERMLDAQPKIGDFLQRSSPVPPVTTAEPPLVEKPGTVIGPYKLLQELGEGGFGVVFMAEQEQPVRRKVALKIIKPGMDSKQVIARFEAERQALALMDHPNIARVLDGGTTESGRPYFVMELVKGIPINEFCDKNRLTPRERLDLFIPVCQAVQHAHQKGIIHRDIKPSNVLVTMYDDKPVPKVIDFGVAKAIEQKLTEQTLFTRVGQIIGTLEYMSPEQASLNALDVDTRADVYALGVLLYELLTGTTPLNKDRLEGVAFLEMLRLIREEEPPKPSTRLSESGDALSAYAIDRRTDTQKLPKLVKGELDWIAMKALEKDRSRRYATANALAADVQRYLKDEQVEACPPTLTYRLQKYARKHKAAFGTAGTIAAFLLIGIAVSTWQAVRATDAESEARIAETAAARDRDAARDSEKRSQVNEQIARDESARAKASQLHLRRALYASNFNLIKAAWEQDNAARVLELLENTRPGKDEDDLRGFEWQYWDRLCHPEVDTLKLGYRTAAVRAQANLVALSADGSRCAAAFPADTEGIPTASIKVWDLPSGKEVCSLATDEPGRSKLVLSGEGHRLVATTAVQGAPRQMQIVVWDVALRKRLLSVTVSLPLPSPGTNGPVPVLSRDGRRVATIVNVAKEGAGNASVSVVKVWDVDKGPEELAMITDIPQSTRVIELSPDGSRVAMQTLNFNSPDTHSKAVEIRDVATGQVIARGAWPRGAGGFISCDMVFSPDASRLAAIRGLPAVAPDIRVNTGNQGAIWDVASGKVIAQFQPRTAGKYFIDFSPDGKRLMTWAASRSNTVGEVWNAATGAAVLTLKGQVEPVAAAAFGQNGTRYYTAEASGVVKVWDAAASDPRTLRARSNFVLTRSLNGKRQLVFAEVGKPNVVSVRDAAGREILSFQEHKARIASAKISPDGRHAVSVDEDGERMVWETATGKVRLAQKWTEKDGLRILIIRGVRFSDDSRRLAMGVPGGGVKVWDLTDFREVFSCAANTRMPGLSPDGRRVATTPDNQLAPKRADPEITVWDVESGKPLFVLKGPLVGIEWSPDGKRIAGKLGDPFKSPVEIKGWETDTGAEVFHLKDGFAAEQIAFSPDSKHLATPAQATPQGAGDILIWDVATGKQLLRLKGHAAKVVRLAFSADGKRIASAANSLGMGGSEIKVWDTATGSELLTLSAGRIPAISYQLFFTSDGNRLCFDGDGLLPLVHPDEFWDGTPRGAR